MKIPTHEIRLHATGRISTHWMRVVIPGMRDEIQHLMKSLNPTERTVIQGAFGLLDGQAMSYAAIGESMELSEAQVGRIARKAIKKMRPTNPKDTPSFYRERGW